MPKSRDTGFPANDAQDDFLRARRRRVLARLSAMLRLEPGDVDVILSFDEVIEALGRVGERDLGIQVVPIHSIVGTVDRGKEFDRAFRPTSARVRTRFERIAESQRRGESMPPIDVYRVGELYFVCDGHHRVAVARAQGRDEIEARVVEVVTRVPADPSIISAPIHRSSWMNPCYRRGPGSIGGAPAGWTPSNAADRRWAVIGGGDSPRGAVDWGSDVLPLKSHERVFLERVPLAPDARAQISLTDLYGYGSLAEGVEAPGLSSHPARRRLPRPRRCRAALVSKGVRAGRRDPPRSRAHRPPRDGDRRLPAPVLRPLSPHAHPQLDRRGHRARAPRALRLTAPDEVPSAARRSAPRCRLRPRGAARAAGTSPSRGPR